MKSPFLWMDGQALSPEEVAKRRAVGDNWRQQASDTSPVGHWSAALARALMGFNSAYEGESARRGEETGMSGAKSVVEGLLSGGGGGGQQGYETAQGAFMPSASVPVNPIDAMFPVGRDASAAIPQEAYSMGQAVGTPANADGIRAGLMQRGLPEHVADAFVMNMRDESGLNPGINEASPLVPGSRGGFGLSQWTGPRRRGLESFAQQRGVPVDDVDLQLDYLMQELNGPEARAARNIMSAPDTGSAATAIVRDFLRPAPEHRDRRMANYQGAGNSGVLEGLMMASADPWVQKGYGGVINALMGQEFDNRAAQRDAQMRQQDPMYQAQLQRAEFENQQMMRPQAKKPIEVGGVLLDPVTFQPIFDSRAPEGFTLGEGQTRFDSSGNPVASGAAKPGARPMSAEERVQWGIPASDQRSYAIEPGRAPEIIGDTKGVTVNNNMGGDKFGEEFAKLDAKTLATIGEEGMSARNNLAQIDRLESLLSQGPSGATAALTALAGDYGINIGEVGTLQAANALLNKMIPAQRAPGSGPMSDRDIEMFAKSLPRLVNSAEGNALIINTLRGIAQYDVSRGDIVNKMRDGSIDRPGAFAAISGLQNPLAGFGESSSSFAAPAAAEGISGTGWIDHGGVKIRVKP